MGRAPHGEQQYLNLLADILSNGVKSGDRTGTGTKKVFGRILRFDLSKGFPLLTTKKVWYRGVLHELLWLVSGDTNIRYLVDNNVGIWNEWPFQNYLKAHNKKLLPNSDKWNIEMKNFIKKIKSNKPFSKKWGDLGPVYGKQWRAWENSKGKKFDQLQIAIDTIKSNPNSRRIIVMAWNPGELSEMALTPCHKDFQFQVAGGKLSCKMDQRSVDVFLGLPFNIASYATLTHMVAKVCNLKVGELIITTGDTHLYLNHLKQAREQLKRKPFKFPTLKIKRNIKNIDDFKYEDFEILNYKSHPSIKAEISV